MVRFLHAPAVTVLLLALASSPVKAGLLDVESVFVDEDCACCYVQGNVLGAWQQLDSGGLNPPAEALNSGSDSGLAAGTGGAIGRIYELEPCRIRAEIEGNWLGHTAQHTTDTFGALNYKAGVTQWSTMANLWVDTPVEPLLRVYGGGGIGVVGTDLRVTDGFVTGQGSSTQFAWQVGTGVTIPFSDGCDLDVGYRFLDCGTTSAVTTGGGRYTADIVQHQLMVSVRWYLW